MIPMPKLPRGRILLSTLLILLNIPFQLAQSAEPVTYEAIYEAKASGLTAEAKRSLSKNNSGEYVLRNTMKVKLIGLTVGSIDERSHFLWQQDRLVPQAYYAEQTGIGSGRESVNFNWETKFADTTADAESWRVGLQENTFDKLSYNLKLRQDVASDSETELVYKVLDNDEIDEYRFRVVAEEVVSTILGNLNSTKISRDHGQGSKKQTIIWLAVDWNYLLVKMLRVKSSGAETELNLKSASVDGVRVVGLEAGAQ